MKIIVIGTKEERRYLKALKYKLKEDVKHYDTQSCIMHESAMKIGTPDGWDTFGMYDDLAQLYVELSKTKKELLTFLEALV